MEGNRNIMQLKDKNQKVDLFLKKLNIISENAINKNKYERAMAAISVSANLQYQYNQSYTDEKIENMILLISRNMERKYQERIDKIEINKNVILFYDGFGLDTRGVALMYLNALKKNGYHIVYVTNKDVKNKQPEIHKLMKGASITWNYIDMNKRYTKWVAELTETIINTKPKAMFFYTKPNDVSAAVSFSMFNKKIDRYLIDLTDHAFWLGVKSNDYFLGSREMSASNQYFKRHIEKEKMIKLGVNLIIEKNPDHKGLPFDVKKEKYIFSGGALYKTLGDDKNTYYKIVDHILKNNSEIKFLYAGSGDASEINKILNKYHNRAYLIDERKDFYYLIENSIFYLNTYPMFGGMMMKYAADAGKIPITLRHNKDSDGLLLNQEEAKIEYDTYEELIRDVDKLLMDSQYLKARESLLEGTVIKEERFVKNVRGVIENHRTDYKHEIIEIDTSNFQKEFYERFDLKQEIYKNAIRINGALFNNVPVMYYYMAKNIWSKITNRLKNLR